MKEPKDEVHRALPRSGSGDPDVAAPERTEVATPLPSGLTRYSVIGYTWDYRNHEAGVWLMGNGDERKWYRGPIYPAADVDRLLAERDAEIAKLRVRQIAAGDSQ